MLKLVSNLEILDVVRDLKQLRDSVSRKIDNERTKGTSRKRVVVISNLTDTIDKNYRKWKR